MTQTSDIPARSLTRKSVRVGTLVKWVVALVVIAYGFSMRAENLTIKRFWVDEAESTINAFTILQHGYPTDSYLGLPIFENTLTQPWPGHPEYEFKDTSYSDRGMAVYHAWLPLYSIAMSLSAFDVLPNDVRIPFAIQRTWDEMTRMEYAARFPAVLLGTLLIGVLFVGAWTMYGQDAAWAALILGASSKRLIEFSQQARYYSATSLFSTVCCIMVWRIWRRGTWLDYVGGAVAFGLLFHTHIVTFTIACATFAVFLPFLPRTKETLVRLATFSVIVLVTTLPWLIGTGFLTHADKIPKAFHYLDFPQDFLTLPAARPHLTAILASAILLMVVGVILSLLDHRLAHRMGDAYQLRRDQVAQRLSTALEGGKSGLVVLVVWITISYACFIFLMPAISYNLNRIKLPMTGPGLILCSVVAAAGIRLLLNRLSAALALVAVLAMIAPFGSLALTAPKNFDRSVNNVNPAMDWLAAQTFSPDTRFYALPNQHLLLSAYTGLPFQCVAPIRKTFLDEYPGPIVLVDSVLPDVPFHPGHLQDVAKQAGQKLAFNEAAEASLRVAIHALYKRHASRVATLGPPLPADDLPAYLEPMVTRQPSHTARSLHDLDNPSGRWPTIFRAFPVADRSEWWQIYFYRFSDPRSRMGAALNYVDRIRSSHAVVLNSGWTIYQCPPLRQDGAVDPDSQVTVP